MISPFDASVMKSLRKGVYQDNARGYFIDDIAAIRAEFNGKIQNLQTREMKLETLGHFPLHKNAIPLLEKSFSFAGTPLTIHTLFANSQIPIFSDSAGRYAYLPPEAANICRYFYELWRTDTEEDDETEAVIQGFAILASYAGI